MAAENVRVRDLNDQAATVAISGTYTSPTINMGDVGYGEELRLLINSQQAGNYFIDQSKDGNTWFQTATGATAAATPLKVVENVHAQYLRVRWTNGAVGTSTLVILSAIPTSG